MNAEVEELKKPDLYLMGVVVKYQRRSRSLEVSSSNEVGLHPSITHPSHSLERWNKDERK